MTTSTAAAARPLGLRAPRGGLTSNGHHYPAGSRLPESARTDLEAAARKAAAVATTQPVFIGIKGFSYKVEPTAIDPEIGTDAFALVDLDRKREYVVHRDAHGENHCTCPDFIYRHAGSGRSCKHLRALVELALVPSTVPTVLPPFAFRQSSSTLEGGVL